MLVGLDPVTYEFINLVLASLSLSVSVIFVRYLIIETRKGRLTFSAWFVTRSPMLRHQMAVGTLFAAAGEAGMRGWTWYARFTGNVGIDSSWMTDYPWGALPVLSALIQCAGLLCVVRVFAPDDWGSKKTTIACVVSTMIVAVIFSATRVIHFLAD